MGNHYHLAAEALTARDLSAFASQTQSRYCAHWRRRHGGSGTLWQGRFKSVVVQKDGYLNELGRYIELNPVRAGLAVEPWDYRWSSAKAYVEGAEDPLVEPSRHPSWSSWGRSVAARRSAHRAHLLDAVAAEEAAQLFRGRGLCVGDEEFRRHLSLSDGRLTPRKVGRRKAGEPEKDA